MATVTLAEDLLLRRRVALKRLHTAGDLHELSRLRREALVGASLNHPNLVAVYDVHEADEGDLVIVMEYVEGETLRQAISRRGAFPADRTLPVLRGVADALDALHDRGIVHRDVKPENILLGSRAVKLADLGLARAAGHTQTTVGGRIAGTFSYMAPEQLEGHQPGPAIDVYALAAVAFEMLSGTKARRESNPVALAHAIATRPPPDLRGEWPEAPAEAAALLTTAMSPDPASRPGSARILVDRLDRALTVQPLEEPPAAAPLRRPRLPPPPPPGARRGRAPVRSPRAAAQVNGPLRGTPAERPRRAARVGERDASRPAASPPAPLVAARRRSSRGRTRLAAGLALLLAFALLVVLVATRGSSEPGHARSASASKGGARHGSPKRGRSSSSSSSGAPASASHSGGAALPAGSNPSAGADESAAPPAQESPATASAPASGAGSAATAVLSFYGAAARHDYSSAWQLADANMRTELAGFDSFRAQQSAVRSITFHRAQVISGAGGGTATVAVRTTAVLADRTEQCSGTVRLVRSPQTSWLLDSISINCVA